jgi:propionate CoA-transferase (EC 2.8.3.1)
LIVQVFCKIKLIIAKAIILFMRKLSSPEEALSKVKDGAVLAVSGFNNALTPEYLLIKLFELWKKQGIQKTFSWRLKLYRERLAEDLIL